MVAVIEYGEPLYWLIGMFLIFLLGIMIGAMAVTTEKEHKKSRS